MSKNNVTSNITKELKIAFKRWLKKSKAAELDGFLNSFMDSAIFMINISRTHSENPAMNFDELINIVQKKYDQDFNGYQERQLYQAKEFAIAQKLSDNEIQDLLNRTKSRLSAEGKKYEDQKAFNLQLFDYKCNSSGLYKDYDESRRLINELNKAGYRLFII